MTLLLAHGANPNSTFHGESVLHVAVKYRCLGCIKVLVEAGADVNAPTYDYDTRTPIHLAIRYGYPEVADYLMAHGVVLPKPESITAKLAAADPEKGPVVFQRELHLLPSRQARSGLASPPQSLGRCWP
jgi:cytochrome c